MLLQGSTSGDGSEQASSSEDSQIVLALRKMMKKEIEVMVIHTVQRVIGPIVEDLIRRVVKEEIQSAQEKFSIAGNRTNADEITMPPERSLQLKFLDEMSTSVLTGKAIQGKGGTPMRVALVDENTRRVVECGPEASAKVEILVLDASEDDNEHNWSAEDFNNKVIGESDKKRPHFAKSKYVYLKEGTGILHDVKMGHDSKWMKNCQCRLGARIVGNFSGVRVKEAWTESFMVSDSRSKLYENHYPPSLSDEVWRLENIGKDGPRCERLNKKNILTVQHFLFLHSIDPERLQGIVRVGSKIWKAIVDHAQTCTIDDDKAYLYSSPSSELKVSVTFDAVGHLKGVIQDFRYVPIAKLSEAEKASALKLLLLAFDNRNDITSFEDEASLLLQFPCEPCGLSAVTNDPVDGPLGSDLTPLNEDVPEETASENMERSCDPYLAAPDQVPSCSYTNFSSDQGSSSPVSQFYSLCEQFGDNQSFMSLLLHGTNPETLGTELESLSRRQSNSGNIRLVGSLAFMLLFLFRVRKRSLERKRGLGFGDIHVQKKQKI